MRSSAIQASGKKMNNKIVVLIFVVSSLFYVLAWKLLNLPHDTSFEFVVRGVSISVLSILTTWLTLKFITQEKKH